MNDYEIILNELKKNRSNKLVEFSSKIIRTKFELIGCNYNVYLSHIFHPISRP